MCNLYVWDSLIRGCETASIIFELKVAGYYDRGKVYQALDYAQSFSYPNFWVLKKI